MKKTFYAKDFKKTTHQNRKRLFYFVPLFFIAFFIILIETPPQTVLAWMHRDTTMRHFCRDESCTIRHKTPQQIRVIMPHFPIYPIPQPLINSNTNNNTNNNQNINNNSVNVNNNNSVSIASPVNELATVQPVVMQTLPVATTVVQQMPQPTQLPTTGTPLSAWGIVFSLPVGLLLRKFAYI